MTDGWGFCITVEPYRVSANHIAPDPVYERLSDGVRVDAALVPDDIRAKIAEIVKVCVQLSAQMQGE